MENAREGCQSAESVLVFTESPCPQVDVRLPGKREFKLPWREAGPPNHLDDKVESDQVVLTNSNMNYDNPQLLGHNCTGPAPRRHQ